MEAGPWLQLHIIWVISVFGIDKLLDKQQVNNYYDLLLNNETSRYIFRILAVKEIMMNPQKYGFIFKPSDLYKSIPIQKIGWDKPISNIASFARDLGVNYKILKIHNPWLIQNHLNNKTRKFYEINIPLKE